MLQIQMKTTRYRNETSFLKRKQISTKKSKSETGGEVFTQENLNTTVEEFLKEVAFNYKLKNILLIDLLIFTEL